MSVGMSLIYNNVVIFIKIIYVYDKIQQAENLKCISEVIKIYFNHQAFVTKVVSHLKNDIELYRKFVPLRFLFIIYEFILQ